MRKIFVIGLIALSCFGNVQADEGPPTRDAFLKLFAPAEQMMDTSNQLIGKAMGLLGIHYKFGGTQPETGFDCSGLVGYVFKHATGLALPHNARAISMVGQNIKESELTPGDLVFYNTRRRPFTHVGIYIGNHRFIHSPSTGGGVEVVDMREKYWSARFNGARRVLPLNSALNLPADVAASLRNTKSQ